MILMNKVFLSKTSYCKAIQCPKSLWLKKYKKDEAVQAVRQIIFDNGKKVGILAHDLFGKEHDDITFDRFSIITRKTKQFLQNKPNIITEASFIYDNNFCMVDILKNDEDGVEIYEVKSSTKISDVYLDDVSFQYYVLSNSGLNVKKVCIIYINKEYVRGKHLDINELFKTEDVTGQVLEKQDEIRENIALINKFMAAHRSFNEPDIPLGMHCYNPYHCDFWQYCTRNLPKPNVFDVKGNMKDEKKFEKYGEGKVSFEDLLNEDLTEAQLEQIDFEVNDKEPKIEKEAIKEIINSLKYPLYFLDYETYNTPIPEVENTRPYQKMPFQYSLHIIRKEGGDVEHMQFLADCDDEEFIRHFADSLVGNIREEGSVIVYNKAFESSVNNEIAEMYPDLKEEMERINANMIDFMLPFRQRNYYAKEMRGSYSIKEVLPALYPDDYELNYENLSLVHEGEEASDAFATLKDKSREEQEKVREALLAYCKLDTYGLVKIYEKFREVIK